jgi:hypothetical protein
MAEAFAGPSNDEESDWIRKIRRSMRKVDETNGEHRALLKSAKSAGMNTGMLLFSIRQSRRNSDEVIVDLRDGVHYMHLIGISGLSPESVFARDGALTEKSLLEENAFEAEDRGYRAGKNAHPIDSNPYEPGTELYVTWREHWHGGQAANAASLGPTGQVASGAKKHPGRKAGGSNGGGTPAAPMKATAKKAAPKKKAAAKGLPAARRKTPRLVDTPMH